MLKVQNINLSQNKTNNVSSSKAVSFEGLGKMTVQPYKLTKEFISSEIAGKADEYVRKELFQNKLFFINDLKKFFGKDLTKIQKALKRRGIIDKEGNIKTIGPKVTIEDGKDALPSRISGFKVVMKGGEAERIKGRYCELSKNAKVTEGIDAKILTLVDDAEVNNISVGVANAYGKSKINNGQADVIEMWGKSSGSELNSEYIITNEQSSIKNAKAISYQSRHDSRGENIYADSVIVSGNSQLLNVDAEMLAQSDSSQCRNVIAKDIINRDSSILEQAHANNLFLSENATVKDAKVDFDTVIKNGSPRLEGLDTKDLYLNGSFELGDSKVHNKILLERYQK